MPVLVMECAHTGTESKYILANTGTGTTEFQYQMDCAHTGTEPKYKISNTGMGTFLECQYW